MANTDTKRLSISVIYIVSNSIENDREKMGVCVRARWQNEWRLERKREWSARKWHCYRKHVSGQNAELNAHTVFSFAFRFRQWWMHMRRTTSNTSTFRLCWRTDCVCMCAFYFIIIVWLWVLGTFILQHCASLAIFILHESWFARETWSLCAKCTFLMFVQMRRARTHNEHRGDAANELRILRGRWRRIDLDKTNLTFDTFRIKW